MRQKQNGLKRPTYQPPRAEIIQLETLRVLCSSALIGYSTEQVGYDTFIFP